MKVFYFIAKSEYGGAQSVVYELLKAHKEKGDEVRVMAEGNNWLAEVTRELGFVYKENVYMKKTFNPSVLLKALKVYKKEVNDFNPDVISCHSSFSGFIGRVAFLNKRNVVYTAHGWGFTAGTGLLRKITAIVAEWIAAKFCKKIICVSRFDKDTALKYHVAPRDKMVVIHNGIDLGSIKPLSRGQKKIVFIGRFARPKRQDLALSAFKKLPEDLKATTEIVFIGNGPEFPHFEGGVKKLGNDNVILMPSITRTRALEELSQATAGILISDWEGFPIVILESLHLGVPVIANAVGGIPEVVDNTVGRILKRRATATEITSAMEELLRNSDIQRDLSIRAKERAENYTATRMTSETFAIYQSCL